MSETKTSGLLAYSRFNYRIAHPNSDGVTNYYFPWITKEEAEAKMKGSVGYPGAFIDVRTADTPVDTPEDYERSNRITWGSRVKCTMHPEITAMFNGMKGALNDIFDNKGLAKQISDNITNRGNYDGTLLQTILDARDGKPFMTAIVASTDAEGKTKMGIFCIMEVEELEPETITITVGKQNG